MWTIKKTIEKSKVSELTGELHRRMCEKEALASEEEKLRKYSMKQQTLIHELRRKLAMFNTDLKKSDFKGFLVFFSAFTLTYFQ